MLHSPQETNMPEASQTKQDLGVGISMSGGEEVSGNELVDLRLSSRRVELWQGFGQGRIPSTLHPGSILYLLCLSWTVDDEGRRKRVRGFLDAI